MLILDLILDVLESNWLGEHPAKRLEILNTRSFDLEEEDEMVQWQVIGKKLVNEYNLGIEYEED